MMEETSPSVPLPGSSMKSTKPTAAPITNAPSSHQTRRGSDLPRHLERLDELLAPLHLGRLGGLGHAGFVWSGLVRGQTVAPVRASIA